jgi:hypothetical protein
MAKDDSTMQGHGVMVSGKDTLFEELLHLVVRNNEVWYMTAVRNENNGKAIGFKLLEGTGDTSVFENLKHDFPQRIAYFHPQADSLQAWVEGNADGKYQKMVFSMGRVRNI